MSPGFTALNHKSNKKWLVPLTAWSSSPCNMCQFFVDWIWRILITHAMSQNSHECYSKGWGGVGYGGEIRLEAQSCRQFKKGQVACRGTFSRNTILEFTCWEPFVPTSEANGASRHQTWLQHTTNKHSNTHWCNVIATLYGMAWAYGSDLKLNIYIFLFHLIWIVSKRSDSNL